MCWCLTQVTSVVCVYAKLLPFSSPSHNSLDIKMKFTRSEEIFDWTFFFFLANSSQKEGKIEFRQTPHLYSPLPYFPHWKMAYRKQLSSTLYEQDLTQQLLHFFRREILPRTFAMLSCLRQRKDPWSYTHVWSSWMSWIDTRWQHNAVPPPHCLTYPDCKCCWMHLSGGYLLQTSDSLQHEIYYWNILTFVKRKLLWWQHTVSKARVG